MAPLVTPPFISPAMKTTSFAGPLGQRLPLPLPLARLAVAATLAAGLATFASCGGAKSRPPFQSGSGGAGVGGVVGSGMGGAAAVVGSSSGGAGGAATAGAGGRVATAGASGAFLKPPALNQPPMAENAGPLGLRRLTRSEYRNTVADLLGTTQIPEPPFPEDEASATGFLAPKTFTAQHTESVAEFSEALAVAAMAAGTVPVPCTAPEPGAATIACATEFIRSFGRRAFRRPVSASEAADLLNVFSTGTAYGLDLRTALTYVISGMLQSPNFLYHWEVGDAAPAREGALVVLTPHQIASRLSYLLWQTMPDEVLLAAADANQLSNAEQLLAQATRLFADPARARAGLASFHEQWLRVVGIDGVRKDPARYPTFTPALAAGLGEELRVFVSSVLAGSGDGTLKTLLTAPYSYLNRDLAAFYGVNGGGADFPRVELDPLQRAGVLTQGAFLATNRDLVDPVGRGYFVWQQFLCGSSASTVHQLPPLPDPALVTGTNRERYARIFGTCADCHQSFDPLGYAFENYDAIGAYQTTDNGSPVNASGEMFTPGGARMTFSNAIDLVTELADSDEVKWCVTRHWFRYLMGRMDSAADLGSMERAYRAGAALPAYSIRDMLMAAVQTRVFRYRALAPGEQ